MLPPGCCSSQDEVPGLRHRRRPERGREVLPVRSRGCTSVGRGTEGERERRPMMTQQAYYEAYRHTADVAGVSTETRLLLN
jgi:hypothetical protein